MARRTSPPRCSMRSMRPTARTIPVNMSGLRVGCRAAPAQGPGRDAQVRPELPDVDDVDLAALGQPGPARRDELAAGLATHDMGREVNHKLVDQAGGEEGAAEFRARLDKHIVDF